MLKSQSSRGHHRTLEPADEPHDLGSAQGRGGGEAPGVVHAHLWGSTPTPPPPPPPQSPSLPRQCPSLVPESSSRSLPLIILELTSIPFPARDLDWFAAWVMPSGGWSLGVPGLPPETQGPPPLGSAGSPGHLTSAAGLLPPTQSPCRPGVHQRSAEIGLRDRTGLAGPCWAVHTPPGARVAYPGASSERGSPAGPVCHW